MNATAAGAVIGVLLGLICAHPALAEDAAETREQLETLQKEIKEGETRAEETKADIAQLQKDYRALQHRLIEAADRLQAIEDEVNHLEPR
ncbi:MAG: hypothetical protein R3360_07495, partial [Alphaproteobacteria bacterium]|nr:hypothetical protein [Alphaproteobacteria bacterium]